MNEQKEGKIKPPGSQILVDESKKLEISDFYTQNDAGKAQMMVSGEYKDLYVIKIKFSSKAVHGAYLLFYNYIYKKLTDCYGIISHSSLSQDVNPLSDWIKFEKNISKNLNEDIQENILLIHSLNRFREAFNDEFCTQLNNFVQQNDLLSLSRLFQKHILDEFNKEVLNYHVDIEYEEISSLDMELFSESSVKIDLRKKAEESGNFDEKTEESKKELLELIDQKKDSIDASKAKYILNGILALEPIRGMHISGLVVKDTIKIKIVDNNPKAIPIAKAFNAYKDGQMSPIIGRIVSFRKRREGGYKIFVEIAEDIYVRIEEEHDDIKVAFVSPSPDRDKRLQVDIEKYVDKFVKQNKAKEEVKSRPFIKEKKSTGSITSYIIAGTIFLVFIAILLLLLFFKE